MGNQSTPEASLDTNLFITVSGPPGCGATTLCEQLSVAMDCPYVSGGDIFREIAEDRGYNLNQLTAEAAASDEIDRALDRRLQSIAEKWGGAEKPFILESRLAGWLAQDHADLRIWLDAPLEVREARIDDREETIAEMRVREVSEATRYDAYYEIDVEDREFYDLQLNTARWSKRGVFQIVRATIEEYTTADDEGTYGVPPLELDDEPPKVSRIP